MLSGKMLYAVHDGIYVIKLCGDVRVTLCATIDEFFEQMFQDANMHSVLIDLTDASGIDSTTLGILAKVSLATQRQLHCLPTIVSSNPDITAILMNMGFDQVFNIVDGSPEVDDDLVECPQVSCSEGEVCDKVLDAHKTLMSLNEQNRLTFRNVVAALESERRYGMVN